MHRPFPITPAAGRPLGLKIKVDQCGLTRVWDLILKEDFNADHIGDLSFTDRLRFERVMMLVVSAHSANGTAGYAGTA